MGDQKRGGVREKGAWACHCYYDSKLSLLKYRFIESIHREAGVPVAPVPGGITHRHIFFSLRPLLRPRLNSVVDCSTLKACDLGSYKLPILSITGILSFCSLLESRTDCPHIFQCALLFQRPRSRSSYNKTSIGHSNRPRGIGCGSSFESPSPRSSSHSLFLVRSEALKVSSHGESF